jgi:glycerol-3-phosphate dehydrogenase
MSTESVYDLAIIGGGINGAGIARDAAGRGLTVALFERGDLAGATSSASSKLIHGGLRYLEHYEFRLVAEALAERETLLSTAPHIVSPLTFLLPRVEGMRPRWMLRAGLWLYDHLARRSVLPPARSIQFSTSTYGQGLKPTVRDGFSYADCWVDDARLVVLNCRSAADLGARIEPRTEVRAARADGDHWHLSLHHLERGSQSVNARALINAAGPWARSWLVDGLNRRPNHSIRLIKGSHIVTAPLYPGNHAFILQNDDGRVVLVIPFQGRYSLIGTTDIPHSGPPEDAVISTEEITYLCRAVNRYFARNIDSSDVLWSFSGVRPLYDDGTPNPSEVTRDYRLLLDTDSGPPLLSIYGGKITTYRRLAEHALTKLSPHFPAMKASWTARTPLSGGELIGGRDGYLSSIAARYPRLSTTLIEGIVDRHGSNAPLILRDAETQDDLGVNFGENLFAREVDYLIDREWALTADDVLWRRTKAGLRLDDNAQAALARYMTARLGTAASV